MAATEVSRWSYDGPPVQIRPFPPSFAVFFPNAGEDAPTADQSAATVRPRDDSWTALLRAQESHCRPPAWTRVATDAQSSTNPVRTIMRRIGLPTHHAAQIRSLNASALQLAAPTVKQDSWTGQDDACEMPSSKLRRLLAFEPPQARHEAAGHPQSEAEVAVILMRAKIQLANRLLAASPHSLAKEFQQLRSSFKNQVTPTKRCIDRNYRIEQGGILGGFRLRSYDLIWPVLSEAACPGDEIDIRTASIADISAYIHRIRPERGLLDEPDGTDVTQPSSAPSLTRPPEGPVETGSPKKRQAQPTKLVEPPASRLSDMMVKLLPIPSPKAEPSPTKSASAPSTPFADTPAPRKIITTSPSLRSAASASFIRVTSAQQTSPTRSRNGTQVCSAFSYEELSRSSLRTREETVSPQPSPAKLCQPVALTPSQAREAESSTPQPNISCRRGSDLGLVNAIPPSTPGLPASTLKGLNADDSAPFDFGPASPSFNSPSWLVSSSAIRSRRLKGNRRKSEPLIRCCYRGRAAVRQSLSPQKLSFNNAQTPKDADTDIDADATPTLQSPYKHLDSATNAGRGQGLDTPLTSQSPEVTTSGLPTPAISWVKMTGRASLTPSVQQTPPGNAGSGSNTVFNVDMRQNLDIFRRSQAALPELRDPVIEQPAQVADGCTASRAFAVHTREHGRFLVRFKLPVEYASKFPKSQGFAEPSFTTMPSPILSISEMTPNGRCLSDALAGSSSSPSPEQFSPATPTAPDETMVPSIAPSPAIETVHPVADDAIRAPADSTGSIAAEEHSMPSQWLEKSEKGSFEDDVRQSKCPQPTANDQPETCMTKLSPLPSVGHVAMTGLTSEEADRTDQQISTPKPATVQEIPADLQNLTTSFTPVNHASSRDSSCHSGSARGTGRHAQPAPESAHEHAQQHSYDSPGRAYMRDFIKRSKPKRLSTTETGSPIAPNSKRQPLEPKSPNTESPQKGKRKVGGDKLNKELSARDGEVPTPKRSCRHKISNHRAQSHHLKHEHDAKQHVHSTTEQSAARVAKDADDDQDEEEMADVPTTRRSSRLRSQDKAATTPKSSIPTPIKLGSLTGASRGAMKTTSRTEQQDLTYQTRMNTRKNKGNAEYPAQVLARKSPDELDESTAKSEAIRGVQPDNGRKCVGWKDPIETHQNEKPKRGRPPKVQGNTNATKQTKASAIAQSQRTAKVAANLGMSANGTPAKAGRVTRSSTRIRV